MRAVVQAVTLGTAENDVAEFKCHVWTSIINDGLTVPGPHCVQSDHHRCD